MTGEEIFNLLRKMAERGDPPRKRERQLRRIAEKEGLSSDALRAKARRFARKSASEYPLMRKPATEARESERSRRREERAALKAERLAIGEKALAEGADWAEVARRFGIKTAEGAAQWWRRNHDGVRTPRRKSRRRRSRRAATQAAATA